METQKMKEDPKLSFAKWKNCLHFTFVIFPLMENDGNVKNNFPKINYLNYFGFYDDYCVCVYDDEREDGLAGVHKRNV